jgi:hypothetical protein
LCVSMMRAPNATRTESAGRPLFAAKKERYIAHFYIVDIIARVGGRHNSSVYREIG